MKRLITITDLTRMAGKRVCIAGYSQGGTSIRPILRHGVLTEDWLQEKGQVIIRPFEVVELDLQEHTPDPPHTEDWVIDPLHRVSHGKLTTRQRKDLLTSVNDGSVNSMFGAPILHGPGSYVAAGEGKRSLGTVSPKRIDEIMYTFREQDKLDYRLTFTDQSGQQYRLAVTDLAFRYFLDHLRVRGRLSPGDAAQNLLSSLKTAEVFLRIGLARRWPVFPDRCYLQVTGVYSFPDYLDGRCFADFASPAKDQSKG